MQLDTVTLPNSLEWTEQFNFSKVKQDKQFTIGGTLVVSENTVSKGSPITLVGGQHVWVEKSTIDALMDLVNTIDNQMVLTLADGTTKNVMFDRTNNPIEAEPVWRINTYDATDKFTLTLRLMEV